MKLFSNAFLDHLTRTYDAGVWVQGAVVHHEAGNDYWVNHAEPVVFQGHTYAPLSMAWEGVEQSSAMSLPGVQVTVDNIAGQAEAYIDRISLLGKAIDLQIFHLDLLDLPTEYDSITLQVQHIAISSTHLMVHCGFNLGLNESFPKFVITRAEFPGNSDAIRHITVV